MSEHNPYNGNYRSWRLGIPMMLLEYPAHPELCHRSMAIVDSYLMKLTGNIPTGERRNFNKNKK